MHVRGRLGGRHGALQHVSFPTGPLQCLVFHADAGEREDGVRQCGPVDRGAWRPHDAGVILPRRDGSCARLAVAIPQLLGSNAFRRAELPVGICLPIHTSPWRVLWESAESTAIQLSSTNAR